jgi:hypothetical protein
MKARIPKKEWIALGGLANPSLFRKMLGGAWTYWRVL